MAILYAIQHDIRLDSKVILTNNDTIALTISVVTPPDQVAKISLI